jgi:hypothetical protein
LPNAQTSCHVRILEDLAQDWPPARRSHRGRERQNRSACPDHGVLSAFDDNTGHRIQKRKTNYCSEESACNARPDYTSGSKASPSAIGGCPSTSVTPPLATEIARHRNMSRRVRCLGEHQAVTQPYPDPAGPYEKRRSRRPPRARVGWPSASIRSPVKTECGGFPCAFMPAGLAALSGISVPVKAWPKGT